jgi:hypothetical protein
VELRVADRAGNPVPGVAVVLRPSSGSVADRSPVTDSAGRVRVVWAVGQAAGVQHLTAAVAGLERRAEVTAEVHAGPAAKLTLSGAPGSSGTRQPLTRPVEITVTDAYGNPVGGATVSVTSRSGKVAPARVRTDAAGRAAVRWVLAAAPGEQRLDAAVAQTTLTASLRARR